jgi:L-seryl-tRNA(Ser) seleniumtransferase
MVGVTFVDVESAEQMRAAINDRTALVMVLASPEDRGPFGLDVVARVAAERKVPVLVDAAAERLTIPNVHLQRGATMVAYSGGKCLRGPQCAGLLLGPRNLLHAAWLNSAPHHAFGRSLKVGKEEIMGMLAAVEAWTTRDHDAEWKQWESWIDHIARRVSQVPSVATEVLKPDSLSNNAPRLRVSWDTQRVGIAGVNLERIAYTTDPRIVLGGATGDAKSARSTLTIMPYMMMPGEEKVVAERLHSLLSKPPQVTAKPEHPPATNVSGQWNVRLEFVMGSADHIVVFEQQEDRLVGTHSGERIASDLRGSISGREVMFRSSQKFEGTRLGFEFHGVLEGDAMQGTVELGEYGQARWTARRHAYGQPGGVVRPIKTV